MKNRIHISMVAVATALLLFSACEGDRDPIVDLPSSTGVEISNYDNISVGFLLHNSKDSLAVRGCSVIGIPAGEYSMIATTSHDGVLVTKAGGMILDPVSKKSITYSTGETEEWNLLPVAPAFQIAMVDAKVNVSENAMASVDMPELKSVTRSLQFNFTVTGIAKDKVDKCEIYVNGVLRSQQYPGTFLNQSLSTEGGNEVYAQTASISLDEKETEFKCTFPLLGIATKQLPAITTKIYIKDVPEPIRLTVTGVTLLSDFNTGTAAVTLKNVFTVANADGVYTTTASGWTK